MSAAAVSSYLKPVTPRQRQDGESPGSNSSAHPQHQLSLPLLLSVHRGRVDPGAALSPEHDGRDAVERVSGKNAKTFRKLPIDAMGELEVKERLAAALVAEYGDFKFTDKLIARDAGASPKTAGNWKQRMNTPSLPNFLRLYARSAAVRAMVAEVTALEAALDPETERQRARAIQSALGNP